MQRQISFCHVPVCGNDLLITGAKFCPAVDMLHEIQLVRIRWSLKAGTKRPQFSMSHHAHCSCKLYPIQHILIPQSASCVHQLAYCSCKQRPKSTHKRACSRFIWDVHITYPLVCVDLKKNVHFPPWKTQKVIRYSRKVASICFIFALLRFKLLLIECGKVAGFTFIYYATFFFFSFFICHTYFLYLPLDWIKSSRHFLTQLEVNRNPIASRSLTFFPCFTSATGSYYELWLAY